MLESDRTRGEVMLRVYDEENRVYDLKNYELVATEYPFEVKLANGFEFTGRVDRIYRERATKDIYIIESKTTGYSTGAIAHSLIVGDQITGYLFGLTKTLPEWNVRGVIPDILYSRGKVTKCQRFDPIYRTTRELKEFELQIIGQLLELSQKVQNLKKYPWPYLFPRACVNSFSKCEYEDICRTNVMENKLPIGYRRDKEYEEITTDIINVNNITISSNCRK